MYVLKKKNSHFIDVILIIFLVIIFCSQTLPIKWLSQRTGFILMGGLITLSFVIFAINGFCCKNKKKGQIISVYLKYTISIEIIIHLHVIILVIFSLTEKRFLSGNIQTYINGLSAIAIFYIVGRNVFRDSIIALIIAWVLAIIIQLFSYGVAFTEHIEFNDISFSTGYIVLYYIITRKKWRPTEIISIIILFAIVMTTFKRIGLAGLAISLLFFLFLKCFCSVEIRSKLIRIAGWLAIIICYLFVFIIIDGAIWELFSKYDINPMGRNYYYKVLAQMCEFSPFFIGYGRNASATLFTNEYVYMRVGNVHSDILRVYMESGFVLFGTWLWIFFRKLPEVIEKKFGYKAMQMFFLLTLYTFFVYLTDNTEAYLMTQYFYILTTIYYTFECFQTKSG